MSEGGKLLQPRVISLCSASLSNRLPVSSRNSWQSEIFSKRLTMSIEIGEYRIPVCLHSNVLEFQEIAAGLHVYSHVLPKGDLLN